MQDWISKFVSFVMRYVISYWNKFGLVTQNQLSNGVATVFMKHFLNPKQILLEYYSFFFF